ncbi:MAG: malate dehydrogenase [Deltaproteobacteria bacterium]|nr:malate dehydrogenase [Deltaproteobacteria bacterium]
MSRRKIALIGAGNIGGTLALLSMQRQLGDVTLFDVFGGTAKGKALDLSQMASLAGNDMHLKGTDSYADIKGADVCIITAGFPRKPGMGREDLLQKNLEVMKQVASGVREYAPKAFCVVVTNPLDAMVYAFHKASNLPKSHVVGMAGVLDSTRFRMFLSEELQISRNDIQAFVLGGHGDDMVPLTRFSNAGGIPLPQLVEMGMLKQDKLDAMVERTRKGGGEIVQLLGNGSAFYTPALSAIEMAESYLYDQKRLLPCATYLEGEYGYNNIFAGVPIIIGANGVEKVVELQLEPNEKEAFERSMASVQKTVDEVNAFN